MKQWHFIHENFNVEENLLSCRRSTTALNDWIYENWNILYVQADKMSQCDKHCKSLSQGGTNQLIHILANNFGHICDPGPQNQS